MLLGQSKKLDNTSKKEIREQAMILQGTHIAFHSLFYLFMQIFLFIYWAPTPISHALILAF
jgi:hypothetical protein